MDPKLDRREESSLDPNEIRGRFLDQKATRGMEMRPTGGVWTGKCDSRGGLDPRGDPREGKGPNWVVWNQNETRGRSLDLK